MITLGRGHWCHGQRGSNLQTLRNKNSTPISTTWPPPWALLGWPGLGLPGGRSARAGPHYIRARPGGASPDGFSSGLWDSPGSSFGNCAEEVGSPAQVSGCRSHQVCFSRARSTPPFQETARP